MAVPVHPRPRPLLRLLEPPPSWFLAAGRVAAAVVAAIAVGYGAIAASASSMPDSPLYPVKVWVEDVTIAVAPAEHRAELLLSQANRRLDESRALAGDGRIDKAERLVEDASRSVEAAKPFAPLAADPDRTSQAIESTNSKIREVDQSLERNKPVGEIRLGATQPAQAPPAAAPPIVKEVAPASTIAEPPAQQVDAMTLPVEPASVAPAQNAPALPGSASSSGSGPASINSGQLAAPIASGSAAVHLIESSDAAPATPTRGGVSAPQDAVTVITSQQPPPTTTPTRTATPGRTPIAGPPSASPGPAGAPSGGFTILPTDRHSAPAGANEADSPRSAR